MSTVYPIIEEEERRRFLDWRFLAALTALLLVAFLVWAGFRNYEIREAEAAQKDALIAQLADRSQQIETLEGQVAELTDRIAVLQDRARADRKTAAEERRRAIRERSRLLRQQERMLELLQRVNITYTPAGSARILATASPSRTERVTTTGSTSPTAKPAVPTAGKSSKTPPGKAKGLRNR